MQPSAVRALAFNLGLLAAGVMPTWFWAYRHFRAAPLYDPFKFLFVRTGEDLTK